MDLTDIFYDLISEGYIYEEDESGLNMSYGEYAAIADYFFEAIVDYLAEAIEGHTSIEELASIYNELVSTADDDTRMFAGISDDDTVVYPAYYKENDYFNRLVITLRGNNIEVEEA